LFSWGIIFYSIKNDKEILKLMIFSEKEWLAITPSGYFNSTKNASKRVKVQINKNTLTNIDAYYETFYRPDIIESILINNKNEIDYINDVPKVKLSEIMPAPKIKIVKTESKIYKEELRITLKITPESIDEYGQIRLYLDGVLIKTDNHRGLKTKQINNSDIYKEYTIKIPNGKHIIKALVYNKDNTMQSEAVTHSIISTYAIVTKPDIYAVVIGINEYNNPTISLKYAVADAKLFAETIRKKTKKLFNNVHIKLLISKKEYNGLKNQDTSSA
jgi:hypothetical protein